MSNKKDHISQEQLIQFLRGDLPAVEQQRMEQLLKKDPFLAEAVEGLRQIEDPAAIRDIVDEINNAIDAGTATEAKVRELSSKRSWYIAAAVILALVSISSITLIIMNRVGTETLFADNFEKYPNKLNMDSLRQKLEEEKSTTAEILNNPQVEVMEEISPQDVIAPNEKMQVIPEVESLQKRAANEEPEADLEKMKEADNDIAENDPGMDYDKEESENALPAAPAMNDIDQFEEEIATEKENSEKGQSLPSSQESKGMSNQATGYDLRDIISETELMRQAMFYYDQDNYQKALPIFREIIANYPQNEAARLYGAVCLLEFEKPKKAIKLLDEIIGEESEFQEASEWYKALALIQDKKRRAAKKLLKRISRENGEFAQDAQRLLHELDNY